MEIKNCAHCGGDAHIGEVDGSFHDMGGMTYWHYVECSVCECRTGYEMSEEIAIDVWNARYEANPSEADRWLKEATEQRARAELLQMQVDELSDALNQARRMLAYAGKLQ